MFVAEAFTGQKGSFVPLQETVDSFRRLCDGDFDHLPEQAFFMAGGISDVEANAKRLAGQ
jgi:F-type H+-transporting ATPase subunit beta